MSASAVDLESLLYFLDTQLGIPEFPDYEGAMNGLQVEGHGPVRAVGAAVDTGIETVEAAVSSGVDLLLVHHGLFWDGAQPLTGRHYRRVAPLIQAGTSLYSAHLPLDAHPELGNCVQLLRALELEPEGRFGRFREVDVGFSSSTEEDREIFRARVEEAVGGSGPAYSRWACAGRQSWRRNRRRGGFIRAAAEAGLDTLLTGEGPHHTYLDAIEFGVNVLFAGHYATETLGVQALAASIEEQFGIPWGFLDFPTGL